MATMTMTMEIGTSFDLLINDYTRFSVLNFDQFLIEPFENTLPEISGISSSLEFISAEYFDEQAHFPLTAQLILESGTTINLIPASTNYQETVIFSGVITENWEVGTLKFSDNNIDFVEIQVSSVSNETSSKLSFQKFSAYPNPFNPEITLSLDSASNSPVKFEIFNVKGQKVFAMNSQEKSIVWKGTNTHGQKLSSGIYSVIIEQNNRIIKKKITLLK